MNLIFGVDGGGGFSLDGVTSSGTPRIQREW